MPTSSHLMPFGAKHLPSEPGNALCPGLHSPGSSPEPALQPRGHEGTHTAFSSWPWGRTHLHPRELRQSHQKTALQINALVQLTAGKRKSTESLISACDGSRNIIFTLFPEPAVYWALLRRPTSLLHSLSFHKPKCKAWQCILMGYTLHRVLLRAGPPEHNDNLKYFLLKKRKSGAGVGGTFSTEQLLFLQQLQPTAWLSIWYLPHMSFATVTATEE